MSGKFLTDRNIFENDVFFHPKEFRLFMYLIGKAVWQKDGISYCGMHLKCGQYIRSYRKIQEDLRYWEDKTIKIYSLRTIKRLIDKLVKKKRITVEKSELGTLFTICNYVAYQQFTETSNIIGKQYVNSGETVGKQYVNSGETIINSINQASNKHMQSSKKRNVAYNENADSDLEDSAPFDCGNIPLDDSYPEQIIIGNKHVDQYMQIWKMCKYDNVRVSDKDLREGFIHFRKIYAEKYGTTFEGFLKAVEKAVIYIIGNEKLSGNGELGGLMKMTASRFLQCKNGIWWMDKISDGLYTPGKTKKDIDLRV